MIVGIVGGGQLARMLALAGAPLGMRFIILDPAEDACAAPLGEHLRAPYDDRQALAQLAARADLVTYEFENVPEAAIEALERHVPVFPAAGALAVSRDRLREKQLFRRLGIPTAPFEAVNSLAGLQRAVEQIGLPALLKTRTLGYDGKGQWLLRSTDELARAWAEAGGVPLILEGFLHFEREISLVAARSRDGGIACYPVSENRHRDGVLRFSRARPGDPLQGTAEEYVRRLLERLDYVGVMALELFELEGGLVANEMAPRVHNSGHWTIEGAETSQFENHLRAIAGLPLGSTAAVGHAAMVNFIGAMPPRDRVLKIPGARLHDYGKAARPGRKVGHATLRLDVPDEPAFARLAVLGEGLDGRPAKSWSRAPWPDPALALSA